MNDLLARIARLHRQGSLHILDRGQVCLGCGAQWPCPTRQIINEYLVDGVGQ